MYYSDERVCTGRGTTRLARQAQSIACTLQVIVSLCVIAVARASAEHAAVTTPRKAGMHGYARLRFACITRVRAHYLIIQKTSDKGLFHRFAGGLSKCEKAKRRRL